MAPLSQSLAVSLLLASSLASPIPSTNPANCNETVTLPKGSFNSSIEFRPCPEALPVPPTVQCAQFSVPLNWEEPEGEQITLGLVKVSRPVNSTTPRIGNLFVNPGGPGGSATEFAMGIALGIITVDTAVSDAFDIIGLDPRGVGFSSQVQCDPTIFNERVSLYPRTQKEFDALVDKNTRLGASCLERSPQAAHVDTISTAKDHEAVRIALGNEKMNWVGLSYGTQLGAQYAQLFPDNIRAMALDGILQHSGNEAQNMLTETASYSASLQHFFDWAGSNDTRSALANQDVEKLWFSLLTTAEKKPIPAPGCDNTVCRADVTAEEIQFNAPGNLINADPEKEEGSWRKLAIAIAEALKGNATLLSSPLANEQSTFQFSDLAIGCSDWPSTTSNTFASLSAKLNIGRTMTPLTNTASQTYRYQAQCVGWPVSNINPPKALNVVTENPILLVSSETDPSTSFVWAVGMMEEIENKVLLTRKGDGHTSWNLGGETSRVMSRFLLEMEVPEDGTVLES